MITAQERAAHEQADLTDRLLAEGHEAGLLADRLAERGTAGAVGEDQVNNVSVLGSGGLQAVPADIAAAMASVSSGSAASEGQDAVDVEAEAADAADVEAELDAAQQLAANQQQLEALQQQLEALQQDLAGLSSLARAVGVAVGVVLAAAVGFLGG